MTDPIPGNGSTEIDALRDQVKKPVVTAESLKTEIKNNHVKAEEVKAFIDQTITTTRVKPDELKGAVADKDSMKGMANDTKTNVIRVLLAVRETGKVPLPDKKPDGTNVTVEARGLGQDILNKISEKVTPNQVTEQSATYLHHIFYKVVNGEITNIDDLAGEFLQISGLSLVSPEIFKNIQNGFIELARAKGVSETDAKTKFHAETNSGTTNFNEKQIEAELQRDQDFNILMGRFKEESDQELIKALFSPVLFESYINRDYTNFKTVHGGGAHPLSEVEIDKEYSEHLKNKIVMLVGKLYLLADESDPGEFFEKIETRGGIWGTIDVMKSILEKKVDILKNSTFKTDSFVHRVQWHNDNFEQKDILTPVTPKFPEVEEIEQKPVMVSRRFVTAIPSFEPVNFRHFFEGVGNAVKTEIEIRRFLHNTRALLHHPLTEKGFYGQLSEYADEMMGQKTHDETMRVVDADKMLTASRIGDKFTEVDYARFNWIHQSVMGQLDPTNKMTSCEKETLEYLRMIYGTEYIDDREKDQRLRRVLAMASGDNVSLTMRFLELGAMADAPKKANGEVNFTSYGKRDAAIYRVFNQQAHENLRFSSSDPLMMGNLLFLEVEGSDIKDVGSWDHRTLMDQMKRGVNSFIKGQEPSVAERKALRYIDWINPAKVGSIYTRAGWRDFASYEHYLVKPDGKLDVVKSFKAIENIGIEIMKDFLNNSDCIPGTFYSDPAKLDERKELTGYLYKKYFNPDATDVDIQTKFDDLEKAEDKGGAYKKFYFQTLARAIKQRIPTKFLRMERTKDVSGRQRMWEEVRRGSGLTDDVAGVQQYDVAVKDICVVEAMLRNDITKEIKRGIKAGKQIHEIDVGDRYSLNETRLKERLTGLLGGDVERVQRAVNVYKEAMRLVGVDIGLDESKYLNEFAVKYDAGFPFAIAVEELERSLLAHSNSGERTIARAIHEIGETEKKVADSMSKLFNTMRAVSTNGKNDFSEIVTLIKTARDMVDSMHGYDVAGRLAHHMASLVISFFKKDTIAKPFNGVFGVNRINSLAAEFVGRSNLVWEWDSKTIDQFCVALENGILPRFPFEVAKAPEYEAIKVKLPFFNKEIKLKENLTIDIGGKQIVIPLFRQRKANIKWTTQQLREQFGGDGRAVAIDMISNYVPMALAIVAYFWIKKALEEAFEKKNR